MSDGDGIDVMASIEDRRIRVAADLEETRRAKLGQVFTPSGVARFIASMLGEFPAGSSIALLDPGAGVGCLTAAAIERLVLHDRVGQIEMVAVEIDPSLQEPLEAALVEIVKWAGPHGTEVSFEIRQESYLAAGTLESAHSGLELGSFDAVIMNPPYGKLGVRSPERKALEQLGVRVANLYTAFLALGALHLRSGGSLAAITPRSFANGLYHEPFRHFFFNAAGLTRIHLFEARNLVFADSRVLQENLVFSAERGRARDSVLISSSRGPDDEPIGHTVPYEEVISPADRHQFLRIPTEDDHTELAEWMAELPAALGEIGLSVSTGRVVDFRSREFLRDEISSDAVPLIYPGHLRSGSVRWPAPPGGKKPNALALGEKTERLVLPNEPYVIVKRFTSKEERRRVSAVVSSPQDVPGSQIAFENHLNVFHQDGRGLDLDTALGLSTFLNSSPVDDYIRLFNGHTQINATDLRHLRYPALAELKELGRAFRGDPRFDQAHIDELVARIVGGVSASESTSDSRSSLTRAA